MTPDKRRPGTPASQGPTRTAPDVPIVANPPLAPGTKTKDSSQLLGPEGDPIAQRAPRRDAGGDGAPPTETGQVDAERRATTQSPAQSPRRPLSLYPLPVWPD